MTLLRSLGWLGYQALLALVTVLAIPYFVLRRRGTGWSHYLPTLRGRSTLDLGTPAEPGPDPSRGSGRDADGCLWIHAVSVGEVSVAATLVRQLPESLPLVITTVTPTGQAQARRLFAGRRAAGRATVAYLPYDFGPLIRRFLRAHDPRALVLVEGDYWPLTLHLLKRRGAPLAVANGRVSNRTFDRRRRLGWSHRLRYGPVDRFGVQTADDRDRLVALGIEGSKVEVTGNLKFDAPEPPSLPELEALLRSLAGDRPILVAGSTMDGEDQAVIDAFHHLGGGERALLVLAPRHPERWDRVARLLEDSGLRTQRRSLSKGEARPIDALLLDSLGELAAVYGLGTAAFIGGTLVPTGGHNPLEPARFAVPTVVGPSMFNFVEMAEIFDRAGAWRRAADATALGETWGAWLDDPEAAKQVGRAAADLLEQNRGAAERTARMIETLLRSRESSSALLDDSSTTSSSNPGSPEA
jgi:3-deoxy-D-manno-octulosonic-acid transferase